MVVSVKRGSSRSAALSSALGELAEQHLAVAGGVQRDVLADPVVRLQGRGAGDLVEVERGGLGADGDVDRLSGVGGELPADRSGLGHQVQARGGGAGQAQVADAEPVTAAVAVLLDEAVRLEGRQQPERRGLVDAELARDLGDAGLAVTGEQLEDGQRAVHRLHGGCRPGRLPSGIAGGRELTRPARAGYARHARTLAQRVAYRTRRSGHRNAVPPVESAETAGSPVDSVRAATPDECRTPGWPGTRGLSGTRPCGGRWAAPWSGSASAPPARAPGPRRRGRPPPAGRGSACGRPGRCPAR